MQRSCGWHGSFVLKALCVLLGVKPAKGGEHWQEARKMMQNSSQFMRTLLSFDKDQVRR